LELFNNLKETFMNKLIATLIVGAFSAAAFAVTPAAPATPATPATPASSAAKADAVPAVKAEKAEGKHLGKAKHEAKKAEAAAPKADAVK
jgi:hypothetical protein